MQRDEKVLILTPMKNAEKVLENYFNSLYQLAYPHELISLAFLESDSVDNTYARVIEKLPELRREFKSVSLSKKDFGFYIPTGTPRWFEPIQRERRTVLAKSRNHLLFQSLEDEKWVLWLDVDVIEYPPDIIERLLRTGKEIVQPHCVLEFGGKTFDLNAWRDRGRYHLDDLRSEGELVRLDAVGGTMLLVKADIHRDGLIFPPFPYGRGSSMIRKKHLSTLKWAWTLLSNKGTLSKALKRMTKNDLPKVGTVGYMGEIETEGLGMMAHDMGYECWGMPNLEIRHNES